jgi:8-oxo-dGTP pyrophosphatase MutT (NUDIX family)
MASSPLEIVRDALVHRHKQEVGDPTLRPAAVCLLLYPKDGEYCILLNKRSEHVEHHKGEISLPGGARDKEDKDSLDTALRETEEEMGIRRSDVTVLGELDEVATRSRFKMQVYVGTIPYPYDFTPSDMEIAEVLEVPINALMDPSNLRVETRWEDGLTVSTNSYAYDGHLVYGATARVLQDFLGLLDEGTKKEEH